MDKAKLMQLEIDKKRRLPDKIKDNISTDIFQNILAAIIIIGYLFAINMIYYNFESDIFEEYLKYFALGIIFFTIIIFEVSYRKKSFKFCFIGIELLICAVLSLYIPYIYLHTTRKLRMEIMILPAILVVYYAIKSILIFKQKKFSYQNNLSDVKEMMQYTEKTSYLDEDSTKTYREKTKEEEKIRQEIINEQKERKLKKQREKNKKKRGQ